MDFKKISIVLNIVFGIAIILLFVLVLNIRKDVKNSSVSQSIASAGGNPTIVYVNVDTLLNKYDMYYDLKDEMEAKQKKLEAEFQNKYQTVQRNAADYQDKVNKGLITRSKAQEIEQQLYADQQELSKWREENSNKLAEETQVMNRQMINNIVEYLKKYNNGRYTYIFSHAYGSNLLYVNDSLDITKDVIGGLNESYDKTRVKTTKK
jgi:outer membrane protein